MVCEDNAGWPPFVIVEPADNDAVRMEYNSGALTFPASDGNLQSYRVSGRAIVLARELMRRMKRTWSLRLLPWKRALVRLEQDDGCDLILNATYSEQRAARFLFSEPWYWLHPYYYYNRKRHPAGLDIRTPSDLRQHRVGGILGYNYSYYGLREKDVAASGNYSMEHLLRRLYRRDIDLFVENREIVDAWLERQPGEEVDWQRVLGSLPVPGLEPTPFHMIFSRDENGQALRKEIDRILLDMQGKGRLLRTGELSLGGGPR